MARHCCIAIFYHIHRENILAIKRINLRDQSLFSVLCAVLLLLAMLMPICSAAVIVLNASYDGSVATGLDANWTVMRTAPGDSHDNLATKVYSGMTVGNVNESDIYDEHWRGLVTWDTQRYS